MTTRSVAKTDGAIVELVSFTSQELDIITDALKIANAHYTMMAETCRVTDSVSFPLPAAYRAQFVTQASEAGELQLKIEAAR